MILNLSNERKMRIEPNNINGSNWILTLPQASGAPINTSFNASRFFDLVTQAMSNLRFKDRLLSALHFGPLQIVLHILPLVSSGSPLPPHRDQDPGLHRQSPSTT